MLSLDVMFGTRTNQNDFTNEELCAFGYDPCRFQGCPPSDDDMRRKAKEYIADCLIACMSKLFPDPNDE